MMRVRTVGFGVLGRYVRSRRWPNCDSSRVLLPDISVQPVRPRRAKDVRGDTGRKVSLNNAPITRDSWWRCDQSFARSGKDPQMLLGYVPQTTVSVWVVKWLTIL
jgi:hypothetical protein